MGIRIIKIGRDFKPRVDRAGRDCVVVERDLRKITPLTADYLSSGDGLTTRRNVVSFGVSDVHQALDAGTTGALLLTGDTGQGRRRPSVRIGSGKLYYILSNPIYVGRVRHGETLHAGEHDSIVTQDLFNAVQAKLTEQAQCPRGSTLQPDVHLLAGLIRDGVGDPCRPTHATKGGKRYRYYVSKVLLKTNDADRSSALRLSAREIEILVISELRKLLDDAAPLTRWLETAGRDGSVEVALRRATQLREDLADAKATDRLRRLLAAMIDRVTVSSISVELSVNRRELIGLLLASDGSPPASIRAGKAARSFRSKAAPETGSLADRAAGDDRASPSNIDLDGPKANTPSAADTSNFHTISLPLAMRRRGFERRLVTEGQEAAPARPDRPLIEMTARAHLYLRATTVEGLDRRQVAQRNGTRAEDVGRVLPLAFLSPEVTDAILTGRQPSDLSVIHMARQTDLPLAWTQQSDELGF